APARQHEGKTYRVWQEVEQFTDVDPAAPVYVVDRLTGTITFAPAVRQRRGGGGPPPPPPAPPAAPPPRRGGRPRYPPAGGGGAAGNVAPGTLPALKDAVAGLPGLGVTTPAPATGGRAAETLQNALVRGPQELHSLERAVTARDFQLVAQRSGAVARARAFT